MACLGRSDPSLETTESTEGLDGLRTSHEAMRWTSTDYRWRRPLV